MRLLRHPLRHLCAGVRTSAPPTQPPARGCEDEADVQVCLTDCEDNSFLPPTAQPSNNAATKVIHGGRNTRLPPAVEHISLRDAQARTPDCQEYLRLARRPRAAWPPHLRHTPLQFCVLHDFVYVRIGGALPRVILLTSFRSRAIQAHHLCYYGGHSGVFKTAARLASRHWWLHLQRVVCAYFRRCALCMANTDAPRKWKWLNLHIGTPFELMAIDLFCPLQPTLRGNNHNLVIIDHHRRWVGLVPLPNPTAAHVAQAFFNEWISRWGPTRRPLVRQPPAAHTAADSRSSALARASPTQNRKLVLEEPPLQKPGMHLAIRIPAEDGAAYGKFSPAFRGPYVVERALATGTIAGLDHPVSGTELLANRTRLKFLDTPHPSATPLACLPQAVGR
ncbi:hypothetical protein Emag_007698 [Eimeria magna]